MSERAIYDVRLLITADTEAEVVRVVQVLMEALEEAAPPGVKILKPSLRGYRSGPFIPTLEPVDWVQTTRHGTGKRGRRRR